MYNYRLLKIILLTQSVLVVVIFGLCYLVYQDIKYKNENHHTLSHSLLFQNDKLAYLVSTQKAIDNISSDIVRIDSSVVSKEGEVDFIENLESIARENGLSIEIDSLVFEDKGDGSSNPINVLKIKAKTKGSWRGSYVFLSRLESSPFKIKIDKFSLINNGTEIPISDKKVGVPSGDWQSTFEIAVLKYK